MIREVDPFIGTDGPGNCLPGPYVPLGLVRLSPDTAPPQPTNGYAFRSPIARFSHTHVSGTGGMGRYGNIGVTPFTGHPRLAVAPFAGADEKAACGYYAVTTADSGIRCELTASARVGVHRYRFPSGAAPHLLIDLGSVVQCEFSGYTADPNGWPARSVGGFVEFVSDRALIGRADLQGGWGHDHPYSVYFYAEAGQPFTTKRLGQSGAWLPASGGAAGPHLAAVVGFAGTEVYLHVGISYASVAQARASVARETGGLSFDAVREAAETAWQKVFARLKVEGGTSGQRTLFATLVTRLLCMPSDLGTDDEFPSWRSGVRHFSDFYCLWDSVRNANSLIALFDPELAADFLNCLLDVGDKTGWVPDAWIAGHSAFLQGGCSAAVLAGEAALKNLPGIDYARALRILRRDAEAASPNPYFYGRHLEAYRDLGYVSAETPQCVSRHLEYTYQDWCLARLAETVGDSASAASFDQGARKLWNLWRTDLCSFAPRRRDGAWLEPFDPNWTRSDSWNDPYFYEGSGRQWSWNAQHDFAGLVARFGGAEKFVQALDAFFQPPHHQPWPGPGMPARQDRYLSKETLLHTPYLFHYAGRPDRTAETVRRAMDDFFQPTRAGLHDNEDMGCQSAFYIASALGLYPVFGQDLYWLTTPVFARSEITLGAGGKRLVIEAPGAGPELPYIASAHLNGKALDRCWLRHSEIASGAILELQLSAKPTAWGQRQPPPSPFR